MGCLGLPVLVRGIWVVFRVLPVLVLGVWVVFRVLPALALGVGMAGIHQSGLGVVLVGEIHGGITHGCRGQIIPISLGGAIIMIG